MRSALLLPTKLDPEEKSQLDIGKSGHTAPDDRVAWRWVRGPGQVASKAGKLEQARRYRLASSTRVDAW